MNTIFENEASFKEIFFCHSMMPTVKEREIHNYHEILFYMGGDATLICDEYSKKLSEKSLIFIPKEKYHFFSINAPEKFERFKITLPQSAVPEKLSTSLPLKVSLLEDLDPTVYSTVEKALKILKSENDPSKEPYLYGTAFILLSLFLKQGEDSENKNRDKLISSVLEHIDSHLTEKINVIYLAERLFVSPSTLTHTFKKEMGISLHRYITQKRLIEAEKMISQGNAPTKIYTLFGYNDYSSFYKAYRAFFGFPPSPSRSTKLPKI